MQRQHIAHPDISEGHVNSTSRLIQKFVHSCKVTGKFRVLKSYKLGIYTKCLEKKKNQINLQSSQLNRDISELFFQTSEYLTVCNFLSCINGSCFYSFFSGISKQLCPQNRPQFLKSSSNVSLLHMAGS